MILAKRLFEKVTKVGGLLEVASISRDEIHVVRQDVLEVFEA